MQLNLYAELQGNPGEVFPILVKPNKAHKNFTVEIDGSHYELVALPFSKQGEYIEVGDNNIYIIEKDFGESRITIQDTSKVILPMASFNNFALDLPKPIAFPPPDCICLMKKIQTPISNNIGNQDNKTLKIGCIDLSDGSATILTPDSFSFLTKSG